MSCACAGSCGGCSREASAWRGDPVALKLEGLGGILPTIITPGDVAAYIAKLDPSFRSTAGTAERCANLPLATAQGWGEFNAGWRKVADAGVHYFASWEAQYELVRKYERELEDWQTRINDVCPLSTPIVHGEGSGFPWLPVLVVGALAIGAGAVGYSFYKTAVYAGGRAKKGRDFLEGQVDRQLSGRFGSTEGPARKSTSRSRSTALARSR